MFAGPGGPCIGIHNYGGCSDKSTRINQVVKQVIDEWMQEAEQ